MIKQHSIDEAWTDEDEDLLKSLIEKRKSFKREGESGSDIKFIEDLLRGEEGEQLLVKAFLTGEVKRDYGAGKTKNIFVEHESWKKPSGVATTESDYWITVLDGEGFNGEVFIGIKTSRLKSLLEKIKWVTRGGDASKGKLIRLSKLIKPIMDVDRKEDEGMDTCPF